MNKLEELFNGSNDARTYSEKYIAHMAEVLKTLDSELLGKAADMIAATAAADQTVYVMGNGGSGTVASHWVNDLAANTVVDDAPGFRVISLGDSASSITAIGNDASFDQIFEIQLRANMRPDDVVIAMSVSGNSPNILRGMEYARAHGAKTIGCCGINGGALNDLCDIALVFPSTRDEYGPVEDMFSITMHIITTYITQKRGRPLAH